MLKLKGFAWLRAPLTLTLVDPSGSFSQVILEIDGENVVQTHYVRGNGQEEP